LRGKDKRKQPDGRHPQVLQVIQFLQQPLEIADAIRIAVTEGFDMQFINDCVFIPVEIVVEYVGVDIPE